MGCLKERGEEEDEESPEREGRDCTAERSESEKQEEAVREVDVVDCV